MYGLEPVAVLFRRADVVTQEVERANDLSAYLATGTPAAEREAAWAATRRLVLQMHEAGVRHHDLNVKNVLLARTGDDLGAYLLDVDRVSFGRPSDVRLFERNVRRLLRSARKWRDQRGATFDERELAELVVA
jgi:tRNA A-37 threonylcarbamoyl transferase component Bud32